MTFRRAKYGDQRYISRIKVGDEFTAIRQDSANDIYYRICRKSGAKMRDIRDGYVSPHVNVQMVVTEVYPHYIRCKEIESGKTTSFNMGDLVMKGLEPEHLGLTIEEHMIKLPVPIQIR